MKCVVGPFRILALDVDGTLLDSRGDLRAATIAALARAEAAGVRPVICTGRRYRRARPIAELIGLDAPLVCNSGTLVKQPGDHGTLWRADLEPGLARMLLDRFRDLDHPIVSWTDRAPNEADLMVSHYPTGRAHFDDYVAKNLEHAEIGAAGLDGSTTHPHYHLAAIGSRDEMLAFESRIHEVSHSRIRTFVQRSARYSGFMCEILDFRASKWSALLELARLWDVAPSEICAVGDDRNDVPMLQNAGLGVAMGQAAPEVLAVAGHVTADHDSDGVARFIDDVLLA